MNVLCLFMLPQPAGYRDRANQTGQQDRPGFNMSLFVLIPRVIRQRLAAGHCIALATMVHKSLLLHRECTCGFFFDYMTPIQRNPQEQQGAGKSAQSFRFAASIINANILVVLHTDCAMDPILRYWRERVEFRHSHHHSGNIAYAGN